MEKQFPVKGCARISAYMRYPWTTTDFEAFAISMAQGDSDTGPTGVSSVYPPIALAILAGLILYWASNYGETARQLPMLISSVTLFLAVLDIASRVCGPIGRFLQLSFGAGFEDREMDFRPPLSAELMQLTWVAVIVTGIAFVGILVAVPVFTFLYALIHGRWHPLTCAALAILVVALIATVFEGFLDYDLYRGLLFSDDGYS
jgi:hypothetical protein